jgi:predicted nuclease of predicted toxin-antitoxin system
MKILLDECLPRKLKNYFASHECQTVPEALLAGEKNGELLAIAERQGFEIFLTMDKDLEYEQNLTGRKMAVIIFRAKSNRLADLAPLVEDCLAQMLLLRPGQIARIGK